MIAKKKIKNVTGESYWKNSWKKQQNLYQGGNVMIKLCGKPSSKKSIISSE